MHTDARGLDDAVADVRARKDEWAALSAAARKAMLRKCLDGAARTAEEFVIAGCRAKGIDPDSPASGEEWMSGPVAIVRQVRLFIETLSDIQRSGYPALDERSIRRTPTRELSVTVFPRSIFERAMYPGTTIDVWMQPDVDERSVRETMARGYRDCTRREGKVVAVLGAGNVASIGPTDVLYKLLVEHQVAVLKMHPVNEYLGPLIERAFEPLVRAGYLRVVYGDATVGQHLVHHPGVDEVHMTGSTAVHDRIVWGDTPEEQARRRAARTPKLAKRLTSELGCVTPVIVVPDRWSDSELRYQAEQVATMVVHSASCTCTSSRLLVTWRGWPQRKAFLATVAEVLGAQAPRLAYYPGSAAKFDAFVGVYPQARPLCTSSEGRLPATAIYDIDPSASGDLAFREEAWSPVIAETALQGGDPAEFIDRAVSFCNGRVFGTLSAVVLVSSASRSRLRTEIDRAVAALRYGTVAVNHWSAVSFALGTAPWGAYPGHTLEEVGSGIGVVHNTLMFERPLKTVLWGPFVAWPKPGWFEGHRRAHLIGRQMAMFEARPSFWRLPSVVVPAVRP